MRAYVGGYTTKERSGRGEGINVYRIDEASGAWTHVQLLKDIANPSRRTLDRLGRALYSAHGEGHRRHRLRDRAGQRPAPRPGSPGHPRQERRPARHRRLQPGPRLRQLQLGDGRKTVAFRVDERSGTLTPTGQVVTVGSPSAIVFA
jgi:6-phosphogluconolactonase (cycloisomerase 2 family)